MSPKTTLGLLSPLLVLLAVENAHAESSLAPAPLIQEIVQAVSVDSFTASIDRLAGFYTRNTVSDTISTETGIGAARRWVFDRFALYSARGGGALIPEYFDFDETICDIPGSHRNVLATLPGTLHPDRFFIVGAHLDSRGHDVCDPEEFAPAANDDGSGVAAVIELARVMSRYSFDNSLIFMVFTGEEQGLFGSEAYAACSESLGVDIRGMINLDTISNAVNSMGQVDSTTFRIYSMGPTGSSHRQLSRLCRWLGLRYVPELEGLVQNREDRFGRGGDHQSFRRSGYTAIRFIETNENGSEQHGEQDVPENMDPSYGIKIVRSTAAILADLALAPERPLPPRIMLTLNGSYRLSWPRSNPEADFAGYLLAVRHLPEPGPFSSETRFKKVIDAGDVNSFVLDDYRDVERYAISVAACDTAGAVSLFSDEVTSPVRMDENENGESLDAGDPIN